MDTGCFLLCAGLRVLWVLAPEMLRPALAKEPDLDFGDLELFLVEGDAFDFAHSGCKYCIVLPRLWVTISPSIFLPHELQVFAWFFVQQGLHNITFFRLTFSL
uniref:Secreted protein n=1 Tax=Lotharella globosa TaxID=91324 RepID=A0A7S3Y8S6_9EUKA